MKKTQIKNSHPLSLDPHLLSHLPPIPLWPVGYSLYIYVIIQCPNLHQIAPTLDYRGSSHLQRTDSAMIIT